MAERMSGRRAAPIVVSVAALALAVGALHQVSVAVQAQGAPPAGQATAAVDLTGYWVSVVTEDWRWRMMTPPKGDVSSIPVTAEGRMVANQWDPSQDTGDNACKAYAAPAIMRMPTRLHITWQDPNTLKVETDAGTQTRLFHFGDNMQAPGGDAGWQGFSVAEWEYAGGRNPFAPGRGGRGGGAPVANPGGAANPAGGAAAAPVGGGRGAGGGAARGSQGGNLKVVTTHVRPGYLRRNGVPFSEDAVVTEHFDVHTEPNGSVWLVVITSVTDPKYINGNFIVSSHFKQEADGSKWHPTPCMAG